MQMQINQKHKNVKRQRQAGGISQSEDRQWIVKILPVLSMIFYLSLSSSTS